MNNTKGNGSLGAMPPLAGSSLVRPDGFPNLALWLDAYQFVDNNDGYLVSSWLDRSGNNNHANNPSNAPPVIKDTLQAGQSSLYFDGYDGTDGHLQSSLSPITTNSSIFSVVRIDDRVNDGYAYIFSTGTGGALNEEGHLLKDGYFAFAAGNNTFYINSDQRIRSNYFVIYETIYNGSQCDLYINGVLVKSSAVTIGNLSAGSYCVGKPIINSSSHFDGYISEVIVYDRAITNSERTEIEEYLSAKYTITLGTIPTAFAITSLLYRRPITITNSGSTLSNFQVLVTNPIFNDNSLALAYQFDEASGTFVRDTSGNNIHATASNTTIATGYDGKGKARDFNGINSGIQLTDAETIALNATSGVTLAAWVYPRTRQTVNDRDMVIKKRPCLTITPSGVISVYLYGLSSEGYHNGVATVPLNQWTHIAFTWSNSDNTLRIYKNGLLDNTITSLTGTLSTVATTTDIGSESGTRLFNGLIDGIRWYNRALTTTEVGVLGNNTATRKFNIDYSDLRFSTGTDFSEILPYWKETESRYWVKVPSITTGGVTIYSGYGDLAFTNTSDGFSTFEFFDDFDGTSINTQWNGTTGTPSVADGQLILDAGEGLFSGTYAIPHETIWETLAHPQSTTRQGGAVRAATTTGAGWVGDGGANLVDILWWSDGQLYMETNSGESLLTSYANAYRRYTIKYRVGTTDTSEFTYSSGTTGSRSGNNTTGTLFPVFYSSNGQSKWDWILIRKNSAASIVTTTGNEELA